MNVGERRSASTEKREGLDFDVLQRVLESMTEGVSVSDEKGVLVYTNPSADRIFGYAPGEMLGRHVLIQSGFPPEETERICGEIRASLEARGDWSGEWINRRKDGTLFATATRATTIEGPDGRRWYLSVQKDLSSRKLAEEERDRLWNLSLDPLCVVGSDGRMKQVNPAWTKALGWTHEELTAIPWIEFLHPDDRESAWRVGERLGENRPVIGFEARCRCRDGSYRWLSWNAFPNPETQCIFAVARDVTEARRAREALRESEQRYRGLLESAPVAIWEEDFTAVAKWFETLRTNGVANLRDYLERHPAEVEASLKSVRIRRINREAVAQNRAASKRELIQSLSRLFRDRSLSVWREELAQLWEGKRLIELETVTNRLDGTEADLLMRLHVPGPKDRPRWRQVIVTGTDVSALRRAERELRDSRTRLEVAQRQAKLGVWEYFLDSGRVWWSDGMCRMYGRDPSTFVPTVEGFYEHVPPEERGMVGERVQRALDADAPYEVQHRIVRTDGTTIWVETRGTVDRDAVGRAVRMWGITQDVTERKEFQERILKSEALLNATGAMAKVGGWELDVATDALRWTNGTFRIHELPAVREPTLAEALAYYPSGDRSRLRDLLTAAKERGEPFDAEFQFVTARGNRRWVHMLCNPQVRDGAIVRLAGTFQDVTARKRTEELLRESDERYRLAVRATNDAIYDVDLIGGKVVWSDQFAAHFAGPGETAKSRSWWIERSHPDDRDRVADSLRSAIEGDAASWSCEYRIRLPNGDWADVVDRASIARGPSGKATRLVGAMQDATARKRAEADRELFESRMRDAQKLESLGVLAGGIAHDFNNLLTTILGYAGLAADQIPKSAPAREFLEKIERSSRHAAELCQQMLAYAGKGRVHVGPIDVSQLVRESEELLRLSFSKTARLSLDLANDLPAIDADASQVRQVVMNLAMNAAEAVGGGPGTVRLTTRLARLTREDLDAMLLGNARPEGDYVWLEVADDGCGIEPENRTRIFEPFYSTKFTGRGLGLAAVLGIVRGHGGALRVDSRLGEGTTFRIVFPALSSPAPRLGVGAATAWTGRGDVLIADEDAAVRQIAVDMLRDLGFTACEASDGQQTVGRFASRRRDFAAVLLDLTMPGVDGVQAFAEVHRLAPTVPIVLMSDYTEDVVERLFADRRPAAFLRKPFAKSDLADKLRIAIERR